MYLEITYSYNIPTLINSHVSRKGIEIAVVKYIFFILYIYVSTVVNIWSG